MMGQDADRPGACQNLDEGCGDCELNSELRAQKSSVGEDGGGTFSEQRGQEAAFGCKAY